MLGEEGTLQPRNAALVAAPLLETLWGDTCPYWGSGGHTCWAHLLGRGEVKGSTTLQGGGLRRSTGSTGAHRNLEPRGFSSDPHPLCPVFPSCNTASQAPPCSTRISVPERKTGKSEEWAELGQKRYWQSPRSPQGTNKPLLQGAQVLSNPCPVARHSLSSRRVQGPLFSGCRCSELLWGVWTPPLQFTSQGSGRAASGRSVGGPGHYAISWGAVRTSTGL